MNVFEPAKITRILSVVPPTKFGYGAPFPVVYCGTCAFLGIFRLAGSLKTFVHNDQWILECMPVLLCQALYTNYGCLYRVRDGFEHTEVFDIERITDFSIHDVV
jgi:hypothetical protein